MFPLTCPHCRKQLYSEGEAVAHMDAHPAEKREAEQRAERITGLDVVMNIACRAGILTPLPPPPPPPPPTTIW
mgnify:CR=1 FL=1